MRNQELTPRQQEVLEFISDFSAKHSFPPTFREIGEGFGIKSTNGVRTLLTAMAKKGYIRLLPKVSRGIQIVHPSVSKAPENEIPLLGSIAAGSPIEAVESVDSFITVDPSFIRVPGKVFALRVRGDSMEGAGILDKDIVIVQRTTDVRNNDIIAAIIGTEATVKRFYRDKSEIRLNPENSKYQPIRISSESPDFSIAGKVIGVVRKY